MIEILPMKDREQERKILDGIDCAGPQARVLAMCEREQTLGTVALELEGGVLRILQLAAEGYDFSERCYKNLLASKLFQGQGL